MFNILLGIQIMSVILISIQKKRLKFVNDIDGSIPVELFSVDGLMKENIKKEKISFIAPMAKILIVDDNPIRRSKDDLTEESFEQHSVLENPALDSFCMEGIDMEEGLSFCGGNMNAYIKVLKAVCQYGEEKIQLMKKCMEEKDYMRYVIEAHALKSNAATIGAKEVSRLAKEQEMAGKEGRLEEIDEKGDKLLAAYRNMLEIIGDFLEKRENHIRQEQQIERKE